MDYFAAMRAFARAVDLGSFSKAAAEEGVKVSTVSRYVSALEADLGAALFNRSTRRLHLTEVGASFHEHAARILADVEDARLVAASLNARPQGLLRINIPGAFGRRHVVPHLSNFLSEYPDIRVDATLTDATVDLIASGADLAVRIGALTNSGLVAKRLAPASPRARRHSRLSRRASADQRAARPGRPRVSGFCAPTQGRMVFPLARCAVGRPDRDCGARAFRANDSEALLDGVLAGLGVGLLPTWLTGDHISAGQLTAILPAWEALIAPGPEAPSGAFIPPRRWSRRRFEPSSRSSNNASENHPIGINPPRPRAPRHREEPA